MLFRRRPRLVLRIACVVVAKKSNIPCTSALALTGTATGRTDGCRRRRRVQAVRAPWLTMEPIPGEAREDTDRACVLVVGMGVLWVDEAEDGVHATIEIHLGGLGGGSSGAGPAMHCMHVERRRRDELS